VDRSNGALGDARTAVDAVVRVDEHLDTWELFATFGSGHLTELVQRHRPEDAVTGTNVDAR
ncbi:MAG TPA: hypothetical protein VIV58_08810, partial [Kofleriaceae bacterium]